MKAVVINGLLRKENEARKVLDLTLKEMQKEGVELEKINLCDYEINHYEDMNKKVVEDLFDRIMPIDAIILVTSVHMFNISSYLKTFLDYLEIRKYRIGLKNKYVMPIIIYEKNGEMSAYNVILNIIKDLNMFEVNKLILQAPKDSFDAFWEEAKDEVKMKAKGFAGVIRPGKLEYEDEVMDILKNVKKEVLPNQVELKLKPENEDNNIKELASMVSEKLKEKDMISEDPYTHEKVLSSITYDYKTKLDKISSSDEDITYIDDYKFDDFNSFTNVITYEEPQQKAREITLREKTKNLMYNYRPLNNETLNLSAQLNIIGDGGFLAYMTIVNNICNIEDGVDVDSNITIEASVEKWSRILDGEYSLQKAFMTGMIKVVGNFTILAKLDRAMFNSLI